MTRRRGIAVGFAVGLVVLALAGLTAASALSARADLTAARGEVGDAQRALSDADAAAASAAFERAAERFRAGRGELTTLPVRMVAWVPGVRANIVTIRELAAAGARVADAGAAVAGELAALPGGVEGLAPRDGAIPLEPIAALAEPLAAAAEELAAAEEAVAETPSSGLVGAVADARWELADQLADARPAVRSAAALADQLPAFLGAEGPRKYLLGAQNPAELRGTGGLIGAFAVLTVDDGRIQIGEFQNMTALTRAAPDDLPPPSEDYEARYARFSAGVHGSNINMTPDVPTAATALETLYAAATGEELDGTILADPLFLKALLEVVGPTEVPEVGRMTADQVVAFATREQYALLEGPADERKELLGNVAGAVLGRFVAGDADPAAAVSALGGAVGDGRLRLHAADPDVQAAFALAGVDGALTDPEGDYIAVIGNNAAANKLDTFLRREVTYDARLQPDGSVEGRLVLTVTNTAPTSGLHQTVLGPNAEGLQAGENRTYWSVYCAPGCVLDEFIRNGEPAAPSPEREGGRPVFATMVTLASGQSETLEYRWTVPDVWSPDAGYDLAVDGQPALMEGSTAVRVRPGDDVGALTGRPPMTNEGGAATWMGEPSDRVVLHVAVEPPVRSGVHRIADFLNRPLLEWVGGMSRPDA